MQRRLSQHARCGMVYFSMKEFAEIRAYDINRRLPYEQPNFELEEFSYAKRGLYGPA